MSNHSPQQRKRLLQRQTHREPYISPPKGFQEGRSWIAEKKSGRFYMFCWIPSDPQPKIQGLVESQPPFFRLGCITTDTIPCIAILTSSNQIEPSFPSHFSILVSKCPPVSYPGWWCNSDLWSPLWHPLQVNLSDNFKVPMGGVTRWTMSQPVFPRLPVLDTRGKHREINLSLLCASQILQAPFQGPLVTASSRTPVNSNFSCLDW